MSQLKQSKLRYSKRTNFNGIHNSKIMIVVNFLAKVQYRWLSLWLLKVIVSPDIYWFCKEKVKMIYHSDRINI